MNIPRELLAPLQVLLSVSAAAAGHGRPVPPVTRNACLCIRLHQMMSKAGRKQSVFSREWDLGDHRRDPGGPACVSSRDRLPRLYQSSPCQARHAFGDCLFSGLTVLWQAGALPRMHNFLSSTPALKKSGTGIHSNLSTWEVEAGGSEGHPLIQRRFKTSLGFMTICPQTNNKKTMQVSKKNPNPDQM